MLKQKHPTHDNNPITLNLQQSLLAIHEFLEAIPAEDLEEHSWELFSTALTSEMADAWTHLDRSNMLQLYRQLSKLGYALETVDKLLSPLYLEKIVAE